VNPLEPYTIVNNSYVPFGEVQVAVSRYIGGLRGDNPVKVSNWERELNPETPVPPNPARLPIHWLGQGAATAHANPLQALHSLRDLMVADSLKLKRAYNL